MSGSFTNDSFDWQEKIKSLDSRFAPPVFATVTEVFPRFRANVLTTFGEQFLKVRYFGPALFSNGKAHGRAFSLKKDQLVLLEFIGGSFRSPVITKTFPFATKDSEFDSLSMFWKKFSFLDPNTDIIDFHESGYCVRQTTNKIEVYDSDLSIVLEFDFLEKKGKLNFTDLEITAKTKITGDLEVKGKIKASGEIESEKDLISSKKSFNNHGHTYNPGPLAPTKTSPPI
ncbi:hypothetical protein [Leptospira alstonii]|uniref:Baseplate assembly protein n=1 Tax=Leptospira alstonii serovar Sichuan str. 79601 TaxID=1218565 RepID=M6CUD9_9LEPT|nr:hypothetical protein [Leptospira alstonii]AGS80480.1 hypothetical protein LEP1GSC193_0736 [Leptospira phage vB_LalZ_80412-LE1]EMJ95344.1 hypothetical protein LEP1GSC194_3536 [Leptospira alstonii serovar Sichuan str. 79601]